MGMFFNASNSQKNKLNIFKHMFEISKNEEIYFLYDYIKNPEKLFDLSDFSKSELFDLYEFVLQKNRKDKNFSDYVEVFVKLLTIAENMELSEEQKNVLKNNVSFIIGDTTLIFNLDNFQRFKKFEALLEDKEMVENLKNPEKSGNEKEIYMFNKLIHLAEKKATYSVEELTRFFFTDFNKENEKKLQRLVIAAGRLNLLNVRIDQKNKIIHFMLFKKENH
jgi:hypothetical protein